MKTSATPGHENERLRALMSYRVLDTEPESCFDDLTALAAAVAHTPIALLSLVDGEREWFKSCHGQAVAEIPRAVSFGGRLVSSGTPLHVPDLASDPRFADNPLVGSEPHLRSYVGVPLETADGFVLGALCAGDRRPRPPDDGLLETMQRLARQVIDQLELRRKKREEAWYQTIVDSSDDAIVGKDLGGIVSSWNPAAERLFGYTAAEMIGSSIMTIIPVDRRDEEREIIRRILRAESVRNFQTVRRTKGGGLVEVSVSVSPIRNEGGVIVGASKLARDITGHRRRASAPLSSEAGLRAAVRTGADPLSLDRGEVLGAVMVFRDETESTRLGRRAEVASRMAALGAMAAGVGHEINTPLAVTVANLDLVSEGLTAMAAGLPNDHEASGPLKSRLVALDDALRDARVASGRIATIVSTLREFSKPDDQRRAADVARSVEWALRVTAYELRDRAVAEVAVGDLPPVDIAEAKLGQVLVNLLVNAAHAMTPGNAEENRVSIDGQVNDQGQVVISVRDTGVGIRPELLSRIFDPSFATKTNGQEADLGLSIVQGIVVAAGGTVGVRSEVGRGTEFSVRLPVAAPRPGSASESPRPAAITPGLAAVGRVLVVDDEPLVLQVAARVLAEHEVVCAGSGEEALQILATGEEFDVIITDITMRRVNGMQLYEAVRRRRPDDARRMLFITGGALTPELEAFLLSVGNSCIMKPFPPGDLKRMVAARVAAARAERDTPGP